MSKSDTRSSLQEMNLVANTQLNLGVQPIYADQVIQVAMENNAVKVLLGHRLNNIVVHTATIVLPTTAFLTLTDTLENIFDNKELQQKIIEDTEKSQKALKERFK